MAARALRIGLVVGGLLGGAGPAEAVSFAFSQIVGDTLSDAQGQAFAAAAAAWSAVISDPVVVNIGIGFRDLGTGVGGGAVLGATQPNFGTVTYAGFSNAVTADARSGADRAAAAHLPGTGPSARITLTTAEARALGFGAAAATDGSIEFSSNPRVVFATARTDLASGRYDLIGTAAHEIGHLLGFQSALDTGSATRTALDVFRFAGLGAPGFTAGQAAYFSADGGATSLGSFSVGGSGQYQASHWLQGTGGLMDPAVLDGVAKDITPLDVVALDAVGWDAVVAEPPSGAVLLAGLGLLGLWRGRPGWQGWLGWRGQPGEPA